MVDFHLNWLNWFHFHILEGGLLVIMTDCMIFLSPFLDVTRMSMSTVLFPHTARLWNSLPIECFPLTYDCSGFNSRFFLNRFPVYFNVFMILFLVTPYLIVALQPLCCTYDTKKVLNRICPRPRLLLVATSMM